MENKEFRVRPVTRYIVTYFERTKEATVSGLVAEFDNKSSADLVKTALEIANVSFMPREAAPTL